MNRQERRAQRKISRELAADRSDKLINISREAWPSHPENLEQVWESKRYLVQVYAESNFNHFAMHRLSICRVVLNNNGRWQDGLTWDEIQAIKSEIGFGDWYGVEVYPRDSDVVNVANMRHIWIMPVAMNIGWTK